MTNQDYNESRLSCYSLAHTLGKDNAEQNFLVNAIRDIEMSRMTEKDKIARMLSTLLYHVIDGK